MSRVSLGEIEQKVIAGGRGVRLPAGQANGLGAAAAWLCSMGLDGCRAALRALGQAGEGALPRAGLDVAVDGTRAVFGAGPLAYRALAACDMVVAGSPEGNPIEAVIKGCDSPLLVLGYAGTASSRSGLPMELLEQGRTVAQTDGESALVDAGLGDGTRPADISVRALPGGMPTPAPPGQRRQAWEGFSPAPETWAGLEGIAALSRVASSEVSRSAGAGAGSDEPD